MANGHGGYRKPNKPAAASGPGALSARTDGGPTDRQPMRDLPNARYGEQADFQSIQAGAPMAEGPSTPGPSPTPLTAPSQRPDEPVTAGAALGAGIGPEAAGILNDDQATIAQLAPLVDSLVAMANLPSSTPQFRSFVRKLRLRVKNQDTPAM